MSRNRHKDGIRYPVPLQLDASMLEDRVMYDANPVTDAIMGIDVNPDEIGGQAQFLALESLSTSQVVLPKDSPFTPADESAPSGPNSSSAGRIDGQGLELVFIDGNGNELQSLVNELLKNNTTQNQFEFYLLDADKDGIDQISNTLVNYTGLESVHLVTFEKDHVLELGATKISLDTVGGYAGQIANWSESLSSNAQVKLHIRTDATDSASSHWDEVLQDLLVVPVSTSFQEQPEIVLKSGLAPTNQPAGLPTIETISDPSSVTTIPQAEDTNKRLEVVFIDSRAGDYQLLVDDMAAANDPNRDLEVFVLDPTRDGLQQMTEIISRFSFVDAIHLFSHGSADGLQIGTTWLTVESVEQYAQEIATWSSSVRQDADLLLYGCDLASTSHGKSLVNRLAELSNCDVAASDDFTGHQSLTGDWDLEYVIGDLSTSVALTQQVRESWFNVLTVVTFQEGVNGYSGTLDTDISSASPTLNNGNNVQTEVDSSPTKQALLKFTNLFGSGPNQIPVGSVINSASLTVQVTNNSALGKIDVHKMLIDWNESSTWNSMVAGVQLNGVEANTTRDARIANTNSNGSKTVTGLASTVQTWADGGANFGWVIVNDDPDSLIMSSSENSTVAFRPVLTVDYTAPSLDTTARVNTKVSDLQITSLTGGTSVVRMANGNTVVVWTAEKQDNADTRNGVLAQIYSNTGARLGGEILVNSTTLGAQQNASIAGDASGNFVVVWESDNQDGDGFGIYMQRFDSTGAKVGAETQVNQYSTKDQLAPAVAMDATGDFTVVWQSDLQDGSGWGVYGQRFSSNGSKVGGEVLINTSTSFDQFSPSIAMENDGNFVVTWTADRVFGGDGFEIMAQQFDSAGNASGVEFQVNSFFIKDQCESAVSMDDLGNFVVAWTSDLQDGSGLGIYARTFASSGIARSNEVLVPNTVASDQENADVSMSSNGDFTVSWTNSQTKQVYYRQFNLDATPTGSEVRVDLTTTNQANSSVAVGDDGTHSIVWSGNLAGNDADGVFIKLYSANTNVKPTITLPSPDLFYAESDPPTIIESAATVTDVDSANFAGGSFTVEFSLGGTVDDRLGIRNQGVGAGQIGTVASTVTFGGLAIGTFSGGTDGSTPLVVLLNANATFSSAQALARNITYSNVSEGPSTDARIVQMRVADGDGGVSLNATKNVNVSIVNDAPIISSPTTQNLTEDGKLIFRIANANAITVSDVDIGLDPIKVTVAAVNGTFSLGSTNFLTFYVGDGTADSIMVFSGSLTQINAALEGSDFSSDQLFIGNGQVLIDVDDQGSSGSGGSQVDSAVININVLTDGANDQPVIVKPGNQTTVQDTPIILSSATSNQVKFLDDAGTNPVRVTLSVTNGKLTLADVAGLTFSIGDGLDDTTMTFDGTVAATNAAINGMYIEPNTGFVGTSVLSLSINDLGNTDGSPASPKLRSATLNVAVLASNRAPSIIAPTSVTATEEINFAFNAGNQISFADPDAGTQDLEVTLTSTHGKLTLSTIAGLAFSIGDGTNDSQMTFRGKLTEINPAVNNLIFTPASGYAGSAQVLIKVNDLGNTGAGGDPVDQTIIDVNIVPDATNDAPANTVPGGQTTKEETPIKFSLPGNAIFINDDTGAGTVTVTLTATNGTVSLSNTAGNEFQANTGVAGDQTEVKVAKAADGRFVMVWTSVGQDGSGGGIYAQLYDAEGNPLGSETRINTTTPGDQSEPDVAMDDAGNFVVVWTSDGQDGNAKGVFAQRFNSNGNAIGSEFRVNTFTTGDQRNVSVAMDATGNFVVAWQSSNQDGGFSGIYATRFDAAGNALDVPSGPPGVKEFRVNSYTIDDQSHPDVAVNASGQFVISWESKNQDGDEYGVYAKRFDSNGNALVSPLGAPTESEFRVNTVVFKNQQASSVAIADNGDFIVVWQSQKQDSATGVEQLGIYAQRFDNLGFRDGAEFRVNTRITNDQSTPTVAMDGVGNFVVAWQSTKQDNADGKLGVFAQRYDSAGTKLGKEFLVNSTTASEQSAPSIALSDDGSFVIGWQGKNQDGGGQWGIFGQRYQDIRILTFITGDGVDDSVVQFRGTVEQVNDALLDMVFTPSPNFVGTANLQIVTSDGFLSDTDSVNITVQPVNDAPTITAPSLVSAVEGIPLVFSTANGNSIAVGDIDISGNEPVKVGLLSNNGVVSLSRITGLTFSVGDGVNDNQMTFTGSLSNINAALQGMNLLASSTFAGEAAIQINVDDQGNVGSEPALSSSATVRIAITSDPRNDAPIITLPGPQRTPVNSSLNMSASNNNLVSINDDSANNVIEVTLTVSNGNISLSQLVNNQSKVNTTTVNNQTNARVAVAANGDYVVTWSSDSQDGSGNGIYAQRFTIFGQPSGSEFRVNTTTLNDQQLPVIAIGAGGQFAIAWQSNGQDGSGEGVYVRLFDATGTPMTAETLVNSYTQGNQTIPAIAMDDSGAFVVVWASDGQDGDKNGVFGQRFDSNGVQFGSEFQVNTVVVDEQTNPAIAIDSSGKFVVAWQGKDVAGTGIFARQYSADGTPLDDEFLVNSVTLDNQTNPDVATDAVGNFVIVWQSVLEDGSGDGIVGRRFDNTGVPIGANFRVTTTTAGNQTAPQIDITPSGEFLVTWQDVDVSGQGVYGQRFDSSGQKSGTALRINTSTAGNQQLADISIGDNGRAVAVWTDANALDGAGEGVFQQTLANFTGLNFLTGDGQNDSLIVMRGTQQNIDDAMSTLKFTPNINFAGLADVQITVNDLGNTGIGGPLVTTGDLFIAVGNGPLVDLDANDSQGQSGADFATIFNISAGPVAIVDSADATISDPNTISLTRFTVQIMNVFAGDVLAGTNVVNPSISMNYNSGTGTLTLSSVTAQSLANYQSILRTVTFNNTLPSPNTTTRLIEFKTNDGTVDSNAARAQVQFSLAVSAISDADASPDNVSELSSNGALVGVTAVATDPNVSDSVTYTLDNDAGGRFAINATSGVITVSNGSLLDFESASSHSITVRAISTDGSFSTRTFSINVSNANEAPTNISPSSFSINDGTNTTGGSTLGILTTLDPDSGDTFTYTTLPGGDASKFTIGGINNNALIITDGILDANSKSVYTLTVRSTDSGGLAVDRPITVSVDTSARAGQLWFTTSGNGSTGTASWDNNDIVKFADPNLKFEPVDGTTSGTHTLLDGFNAPNSIRALHYVETYITVGTTPGRTFDLQPGDLLVTLDPGGVVDGVTYDRKDILVYRPSGPGTYGTGTYFMLLDDGIHDASQSYNSHEIHLVERDTVVGGTLLTRGTFIVARSTPAEHDNLYVFNVIGIGSGANTNTSNIQLLMDGSKIGLADQQIKGMQLIEQTSSVGSTVLNAGTLLISVRNSVAITVAGTVSPNSEDIFSLVLSSTELVLPGSTAGAAAMFYDGSDVGMSAMPPGAESINSIAVVPVVVNSAPTNIAPNSVSVAELVNTSSGLSVATLSTTDPDVGDTFTYAIVGGGDAAKFSIGGLGSNELILTDGILNFETKSVYNVTVRTTDSAGNSYDQAVLVNVIDVNESPMVSDQAFSVTENSTNGTVVGTVLASDPDAGANGTLSYAIIGGTGATAFAVNVTTGQITVVDASQLNFESTPSFSLTVQVTDGGTPGLSDTATITINLTNVNEAPTNVGPSSFSIVENTNTTGGFSVGVLTTSDPDVGDTSTYSIQPGGDAIKFSIGGVGNDQLILTDGVLNFESKSVYTVNVQAMDSFGNTTIAMLTVNITDVNESPTITSNPTPSVNENQTIVQLLTATDADLPGQTISYSITGGADSAKLTVNGSNQLVFISAPDFETPTDSGLDNVYEVTVTASDGNGGLTTQTIFVTVNNVVEASVLVVDTTSDTVDGNTSSIGALLTSKGIDGRISLREAIIATNNSIGADTILLDVGTFTFSISGQGENAASTGDLDITDTLTITGTGTAQTIIDANNFDRVFEISGAISVKIEDVTIRGGMTASNNWGAGILIDNDASLTLSRVVVTGNSTGSGAGIYNYGSLVATDTIISNNSGSNWGGGLYNDGGNVVFNRVTVSGNTAGKDGGGINNSGSGATMSLTNVTLSGNIATDEGGGLWTSKMLAATNITIAFNDAASGDGIFMQGGGAEVQLKNSLLFNPSGENANRAVNSLGHNIDSDGTSLLGGAADQSGVNPRLDANLMSNGGYVTTHRLLLGSTAIDAADSAFAPLVDARNMSRDSAPDIGAFEVLGQLVTRSESLVNTSPANSQSTFSESRGSTRAVALANDGSNVVVWSSLNQDGSGWGVYGQRFDATGTKVGTEFQINETTTNDQKFAAVAMNGRGDFVVSWTSVNQDGSGNGVYARRFNSTGSAVGNEFLVNSTTSGSQDSPIVGMSSDGGFLVVWEGEGSGDMNGIFGRWFAANGTPLSSEILINTTTLGVQSDPSVSMTTDGRAVVVWNDTNGVWAQRYDVAGAVDGGVIHIESNFTANSADVAMDENGGIVVAYTMTIFDAGVYFRRYDSNATALTPFAQIVNTTFLGDQSAPSIAMDDSGDFLIVWEGVGNLDADGVFGRRYNENGTPLSNSEFRVSETISGTQRMASAVIDNGGNFLVVWSGNGVPDSDGVYSRQFSNSPPTISTIADQTVLENDTTNAISFTVDDVDSSASILVVTAESSNLTLVSPSGIVLSGSGTTRSITVTPNANQSGTVSITVTVSDGAIATSTTFILTITKINTAPLITSNGGGNTANLSIAEGTTAVTTVLVSDPESPPQVLTYSIVASGDGAFFTINGSTGALRFSTARNYETPADLGSNNIYDVTIQVSDGNGGIDTQSISVTITDVNELPVIANQSFSTPENSVNGTVVGTVISSDPDLGANGSLSYAITGGTGSTAFAINAMTGQISVADASQLNFEATPSFALLVTVTDGGTPSLNATATITINLTNVNESPTDVLPNSFSINEQINTTGGRSLGTLTVSDPDISDSFTLTIQPGGDASKFSIGGAGSKELILDDGVLDFETKSSYTVTVRVRDAGGLTYDETLVVNVNNLNDTPTITSDGAGPSATQTIAENLSAVTIVTASDEDLPAQTLVYSIVGGADSGKFSINGSTGALSFTAAPNFEVRTDADLDNVYEVIVQVSDGVGGIDSQAISVTVTEIDEFDVSAVVDSNIAVNAVSENASNGTVVGVTAQATDADGTNNTITYSLTDNAGGRFAIDTSTGVVTVANGSLLDRETTASHNITVQADSSDGSVSTSIFTISVNDIDEFNISAISDVNVALNSVNENAANGSAVRITAFATDADATNNVINYTLTNNAGGRFAINASSGVVTVANSSLLDREIAATHNIGVRATSSDGSFSTRLFTISVVDIDEFDVGPIVDLNAAVNSVDENAAIGTTVGVIALAIDDDATNNTITYSLDDDASGRFAVDALSGVVTVLDGSLLDREISASHDILVRATSSDGSSSLGLFTIAVNDIDEFDVSPVSDIDLTVNNVTESAANGTVVGITALAIDNDATTNAITYSLDNNAGGRFTISGTTGVVTVADGSLLDRESAASHNISVRATSTDGSASTQAFTINLIDVDEFDISPINDTNPALNSVDENASNGTVVGIAAFASDGDATNNTITYSLDNNAVGRFAINGTTGVVTVADGSLLDRESAASHNITVRAISGDGSASVRVFTINVNDVDEFNVGPVTDVDAVLNSVDENAANGSVVSVTAFATDSDATNNAITYSLDDNAGGRFAIDATTGVVTVLDGTLLDRESAASHNISVRATSTDGSASTQAFTINLIDVDEFDISPISDTNPALNSVDENASNGTVVGITAFASDGDATNSTITYALDDNAGGRFAIHGMTGVVTVANSSLLDRETASSHNITVRATSADGSTVARGFTINVNDVNEYSVSPISDVDAAANAVSENAINGTVVGLTAFAIDGDATNSTVMYSLDNNAGGRFAINGTTGMVTVLDGTLLDREVAASYNIVVRAASTDGSASTQAFTINLTDVDEFDISPISDTNPALNSVDENASNGTVVGITAFASDGDATNSTITYALDDNAGGRFAIHGTTGVVTVANSSLLDRETASSHNITVRATSADGSTAVSGFTINVNDVNEFSISAVLDTDATVNAVDENAVNGTVVGLTAFATDGDAMNSTVTYSLDNNAGGRFAINGTTGIVTVLDGILLDREVAASYNIVVRATSADGSASTQAFIINLIDVDEFDISPISDTNPALNSVNENASNGTVVGITAFASDGDATNSTITYSLDDNAGGRFAINAATGVVQVADGSLLDRESAASHNITVRAISADGSTVTRGFTISVNDVNEFSISAVSDTDATVNAVDENAISGTVVGVTAFATDSDATNNAITYSLDGNAGGRFAIDATTGVVTVLDGTLLDREASASHNVVVRATSSDGSFATAVFTIAVRDLDEFDVNVPVDIDSTANFISDNTPNGSVVGLTASATDSDATNSSVTYSLVDDAGGRFAIDSVTGVVTVLDESLLDWMLVTSHDIVVQATSVDGSVATATFTIAIGPPNVAPTIDPHSYSIAENASIGAVVDLVPATDPNGDTLAYSIVGGNLNETFAIDSLTGEITVADPSLLDYESIAGLFLTVQVEDPFGAMDQAVIWVSLVNQNEKPVATADSFSVATGQTLVASSVLGNDSDVDGDTLLVALVAGPSSGTLTLNADGTFEFTPSVLSPASVAFTYQATDSSGSAAIATVTINISGGGSVSVVNPPKDDTNTTSTGGGTTKTNLPDDKVTDVLIGSATPQDEVQNTGDRSVRSVAVPENVIEQPVAATAKLAALVDSDTTSEMSVLERGLQLPSRATNPLLLQYTASYEPGLLSSELWELRKDLENITSTNFVGVGTVAGFTSFLTVGYVLWALRSGWLISTILTQMPAWRIMDPLIVLDYLNESNDKDDDDSLEAMLEKNHQNQNNPPKANSLA